MRSNSSIKYIYHVFFKPIINRVSQPYHKARGKLFIFIRQKYPNSAGRKLVIMRTHLHELNNYPIGMIIYTETR